MASMKLIEELSRGSLGRFFENYARPVVVFGTLDSRLKHKNVALTENVLTLDIKKRENQSPRRWLVIQGIR